MIVDSRKYGRKIWFSNEIESSFVNVYYQSPVCRKIPGMIRSDFYTKIIDLTKSENEIFGNFDKGTKYEIRRAKGDGVEYFNNIDFERVINFYNEFAKTKNLKLLNAINFMNRLNKHCTFAKLGDDILACHFYLYDKSSRRVRLLNSGTKVSVKNQSERAAIGRANRYLHWEDIKYFKGLGFVEYDIGGYAYETKNKSLIGINAFKDSFGGYFVKEYHYYPIFIWIGIFIQKIIVRLKYSHIIKKIYKFNEP